MKELTELLAKPAYQPLKKLISSGNTKIPSTTAIFNMSSATDCPSRKLGLCKVGISICYAKKAEYSYRPDVLPFRRRQEKFWKDVSAKEFASQFILINYLKRKKFDSLRLNESGDFHDQMCVVKAEKIARILKKYGVTVYCYTSRDDLDFSHVKALKISGSNFKSIGVTNIFKMINKKSDKPKGYGMCAMDCKVCNRCMKSGMKTCVIKH